MPRRSSRPHLSPWWIAALLIPALATGAQDAQREDWCDESRSRNDSRHLFCEVREYTLDAPRGVLTVDGGTNGGIQIESWDRKDVRVLAKVEVWADSRQKAAEVGENIRVTTTAGRIEASGPSDAGKRWSGGVRARPRVGWGVSYRLRVPRHTDLALATHNGGISVVGVTGQIRLEALNGALALREVGGDVLGHTTNGAVVVDLDGRRWSGEGLDLVTTNGSVMLRIPKDYSAKIETGTTNGRMSVDYPLEARGYSSSLADLSRHGRRHGRLRAEIGTNGAPIRVITTNGSVKVTRAD